MLLCFKEKGRKMKTLTKIKRKAVKKDKAKKDVIAYRKACDVQGTGLSHYILMDRKTK
jgi:modified peptide precursor CbpA